jgi:hypothetical protein
MQRFGIFFTQSWYLFLDQKQKELVRTSIELYAREERMESHFEDYSFLVFPIAKAYEGFLKKYFFESQMISTASFYDKKFRIGRVLNPDMHPDRRNNDWIYDKVVQACGQELARQLWETWIKCRNQIFHYYPNLDKNLSLSEASSDIMLLAETMQAAVNCQALT